MDVLVTSAVNNLRKSIEDFNQASSRQTTTMIRLTWVITGLTALMTAAVVVQIILALKGS